MGAGHGRSLGIALCRQHGLLSRAGAWRGYAVIFAFSAFAVVYLGLLCRATDLDTKVGNKNQQIQRAKWEVLIARQQLHRKLHQQQARPDSEQRATPPIPPRIRLIETGQLPRIQPSVLSEIGGVRNIDVWRELVEQQPRDGTRLVSKP